MFTLYPIKLSAKQFSNLQKDPREFENDSQKNYSYYNK